MRLRSRVLAGSAGAALLVAGALAGPAAAARWSPDLDERPSHGPATPAPDSAARHGWFPTAGAPGLGDPFFPLAGNGGYDVEDYDLRLAYEPATRRLEGWTRIRARATQGLSRFDLDLRGFTVAYVRVEGQAALFTRDGQELVITPRRAVAKGRRFTVDVKYAGVPEVVTDPDGSIEGWVPTSDGAFVVNEPQGAPSWFPANDNPRDKATYRIAVTVPRGITALANGTLEARLSWPAGRTTWVWRERSPMATYLTTATLGVFDLTVSKVVGVPSYVAVDPSQAEAAAPALARLPEMTEFLQGLFGRYPFGSTGAIVDDAPEVGYALESQTKPNYDSAPDEYTVLHEQAHQWFGNSVTLTTWPEIWLNEGFATYAEWLWSEHVGEGTAQEIFDDLYAVPPTSSLWDPAPAALPGPEVLFSAPVYLRGAMTLHALRVKVGDAAFFTILRRWYGENRDGNVTTADLIALSERVSGMELDTFFAAWLTTPGKPTSW